MHWKVFGQYSKNTNFWKRWGLHDPLSSYGGAVPDYEFMTDCQNYLFQLSDVCASKTVDLVDPVL